MDWRGKTVVITGGSAGIGFAAARAFAERGANLALLARDPMRLEHATQELRAFGIKVDGYPTDVAEASQVKSAALSIEENFGRIDLWINNATVSVLGEVDDITEEEFRRVTEVTYLGYVYGTKVALECMKRQGFGKILQVSSGLAFRSIPLQSAYCAAKHAILGFTESLRTELFHQKSPIRISLIHLPAVNTPQFSWTENHLQKKFRPMSPVYAPEYIATQIVWAAERDRREVFVGGMTVLGTLAQKISPNLLDRYLASQAYGAQLSEEPKRVQASSNLWLPVPGYFGAKGEFLDEEKSRSFQVWFTKNRVALLSLSVVLAAVLLGFQSRNERKIYVQ